MLPEVKSKGTTRAKHLGYHKAYSDAIAQLVDDIDQSSKCDMEKQSLQARAHKALKKGELEMYTPVTAQDWINLLKNNFY